MAKVIFDISMSLDGYIAAANVRPEAGLGDGGEQLHDWGFNSEDPRNRKIMASIPGAGAFIFGRNTYDLAQPLWGADGPTGPARVPTFIVTHKEPEDTPDNSVYTFVDGIETALEQAKKAAGNKDVTVIGGADIARQFIKAGLLDEISIHLIPVLFGSGVRLFDHIGTQHIQLETAEVIPTAEATHIRFRIVK